MNRRGFLKSAASAALVSAVAPSAMGAVAPQSTALASRIPNLGGWERFAGLGMGLMYYFAWRAAPKPSRPASPKKNNGIRKVRMAGELGGGMRRIMVAVAESSGATRTEVAILSHMTPGSGTYSTYLGRLRSSGYIADEGDKIVPTEAGIEALGEYEEIPIGGWSLVEAWGPTLGGGGVRRLFDALAEAGMEGLSRDALAEAAGLEPSSGTYSTYLGRLRKKGLTVGTWPLRLHPIFFSEDA